MTKVYLSYNNIISALGFDSPTVISNIEQDKTGLSKIDDPSLLSESFISSMIDESSLNLEFDKLNSKKNYTKLEKMMILSLSTIIDSASIDLTDRTGLIISTTKGNIDALESTSEFPDERAYLGNLGSVIRDYFGFKDEPLVISNACVSGLLAVSVAKRYIQDGIYDTVFIVAGDLVSKFVLAGFKSFQAISDEHCKPYSANRKGINTGEAAVSVLVTSNEKYLVSESVEILGDASCNDANHISGPSRTGEGLYRAVNAAMEEAKINSSEIDYISAHGTATEFNDEMEAIAFNRLGLGYVPLNSLKGYFGHTMGASGLLETVVGMHSLKNNKLYKSMGFDEMGTSKQLNIIESTKNINLNLFLKTASGFGGSNTAGVFKKVGRPDRF